jgi:hypothetical protein
VAEAIPAPMPIRIQNSVRAGLMLTSRTARLRPVEAHSLAARHLTEAEKADDLYHASRPGSSPIRRARKA